jgi:hypothetical protein
VLARGDRQRAERPAGEHAATVRPPRGTPRAPA